MSVSQANGMRLSTALERPTRLRELPPIHWAIVARSNVSIRTPVLRQACAEPTPGSVECRPADDQGTVRSVFSPVCLLQGYLN